MSRYRLRFLLQELDLHGPEIIIGRSADCQITIEDPLVSRRHARIIITDSGVRVVDLGSRNGVRINGNLIRGEAVLRHNDRLRLGTQDLVFLVIDETQSRTSRATGFMTHCQRCSRPFPGESAACPHCGEAAFDDPESNTYETITGMPSNAGHAAWTFQLLAEVIERALGTGRLSEAERMMQRAASDMDERLRVGAKVDPKHLSRMALYALRLARLTGRPEWAEWALTLHRQHELGPAAETLDELEGLSEQLFASLRPSMLDLAQAWLGREGAEDEDDEARSLRSRMAALAGQA